MAPTPPEPPPTPAQLRAYARALLKTGGRAAPLYLLRPLAKLTPEDPELWALVAEVFYGVSDGGRTRKAADLAIAAAPGDPVGYVWKIRSLLQSGQPDEARQEALRAIELVGGCPEFRELLAEIHLRRGMPVPAIQELDAMAASGRESPGGLALRGEALAAGGDAPGARECFEAALRADSECAAAWADRGKLRLQAFELEDAARDLQQAVYWNCNEPLFRQRYADVVDDLIARSLSARLLEPVRFFAYLFAFMALGGLALQDHGHPTGRQILLGLLGSVGAAAGLWLLSWLDRRTQDRMLNGPLAEFCESYLEAKKLAGPRISCTGQAGKALVALLVTWLLLQLLPVPPGLRLGVVALAELWALSRTTDWGKGGRDAATGSWNFPFPGSEAQAGDDEDLDIGDLAVWIYREGKPDRALRIAEHILRECPEDGVALRLQALALLARGEHPGAMAAACTAAALHPESAPAKATYWWALWHAGERERLSQQAASPTRQELNAVYSLLAAYLPAALEASRAGAELVKQIAPDSGAAYGLAGAVAMCEQRPEDAEAAFRAAAERDPSYVFWWQNLAITLGGLRRNREAAECWHRALNLNPSDRRALTELTGYRRLPIHWGTFLFAVILGVIGLVPTIIGSKTNGWMPWISFGGPWVLAVLAGVISRFTLADLRKSWAKELPDDNRGAFMVVVVVAFAVLLGFHTLQAWLEIALHPALFEARWRGAGLVTAAAMAGAWWLVSGLIARRTDAAGH